MIKTELVNFINDYGDIILNRDDAVEFMLEGENISGVMIDDEDEVELYHRMATLIEGNSPTINKTKTYTMEPDKHLRRLSKKWLMPPEYQYLDVVEYLISRCTNNIERKRVADELEEFHKRNEIDVLKVMIYIVDQFRKNNVVWGVGRGSSVSCFCLYLIGINKINPLKYDISYTEFFKE